MHPFLLLPLVFSTILCSGFLELHLQSSHEQKALVNISSSEKSEKAIVIPVTLKPGQPLNVTRIRVNFDRIYNVSIKCGESKEDGEQGGLECLTETTIVSQLAPLVGLLSPAAVARPLNGLKLTIGCYENWFGEKCDIFCDEKKAKKSRKRCNSRGKSACPDGFSGVKCEKILNQKTCKCENQGKCVDSTPEAPICECPIGFNGEKCEKKSKSASLSSHYKGDFWNFRMTFWQMIFSNLVENRLAEVKESDAWRTINSILGMSDETPFAKRPNETAFFPVTGSVDLSSISE